MRSFAVLAALVICACSEQQPQAASQDKSEMDSMTKSVISDASSSGGTPFDVPSDANARYFLLKVQPGENGHIIATTRREGPSGTSFARREIDCAGDQFRYVGEGDTLAEAEQPAPNPGKMSDFVEGSISDVASKFACSHRDSDPSG